MSSRLLFRSGNGLGSENSGLDSTCSKDVARQSRGFFLGGGHARLLVLVADHFEDFVLRKWM